MNKRPARDPDGQRIIDELTREKKEQEKVIDKLQKEKKTAIQA
ncbi:hypothetical protein [Thermoplasma volcanium]|nr:hypothetical protein [Thermoplasma volcanium]